MPSTLRAIGTGMLIVFAGSIPWDIVFNGNFRVFTSIPWAVPVIAVYLWFFWRYLSGDLAPDDTSHYRRESLRARPLPLRLWIWSMTAGLLGLVALVLALRVANRMIALPVDTLPDLSQMPRWVIYTLLLASAPVAGIIEESAFRGYMQKPLEERYGLPIAILITGTMFGLAHLSFTLVLWPYYVAVAALYGTVTAFTKSILPAIALHALGNIYSNFDLLLHGRTDWQADGRPLIWETGPDPSFWISLTLAVLASLATIWAMLQLRSQAVVMISEEPSSKSVEA